MDATCRQEPLVKRLHNAVIDQIAAGEVVERPASVVKELLENALDAGAQNISIEIEGGGLGSIIIADDGCGMSPLDARLCIERHATSKLACAEDLQHISTLGFRGEALSSICAVADVLLTTRQAANTAGFRLHMRAGDCLWAGEAGAARGTCVQVTDLFFNTPARRKFMRSPATEQAHLVEAVSRVMLGARHAGVSVRHGSRLLLHIPAGAPPQERVAAVVGPRVKRWHALTASADESVQVSGFVGVTGLDRADSKTLLSFVNGRFVRDRMLMRAVQMAHQAQGASVGTPVTVLFIDIEPNLVDVNVHPQKTEVRFADAHAVYRAVTRALANALVQPASLWRGNAVAKARSEPRPAGPMAALPAGSSPAAAAHESDAAVASNEAHEPAGQGQTSLLTVIDDRFALCRLPHAVICIDWPVFWRARARLACVRGDTGPHALLLPETFVVQAPWADWLQENDFILEPFGFVLEQVAPRSYAIKAIPQPLRAASATPLTLACIAAAHRHALGKASQAFEAYVWEAALGCVPAVPDPQDLAIVLAAAAAAEGDLLREPGVLRLDGQVLTEWSQRQEKLSS